MKYITLGKTNKKISIIGLGSWAYGKENISNGSSVGWSGQSDFDSTSALKKSFSLQNIEKNTFRLYYIIKTD